MTPKVPNSNEIVCLIEVPHKLHLPIYWLYIPAIYYIEQFLANTEKHDDKGQSHSHS